MRDQPEHFPLVSLYFPKFPHISAESQLHILPVYAKIRKAFTIGGVLSDGTKQ